MININNIYYFKVKNNKKRFFIVEIYQTLTFFNQKYGFISLTLLKTDVYFASNLASSLLGASNRTTLVGFLV